MLTPLDRATAPAKLAHVVFRSANKDRLRDWYATVLGARVVFDNPFLCFLTYDAEHHRVAILQVPNLAVPAGAAPGVDHVAFTFATLGDLLHTWRRLDAQGVMPYWCINHGPTTSLYYRDPDGNQIELQIDNFASDAALRAWFRSGAFAKNPIGVPFDPKRLLERWEAGDPLEELVQQGAA
jgi:catechol 2,3-dioxygenase-like lactoylglutathione lyase family enzyme